MRIPTIRPRRHPRTVGAVLLLIAMPWTAGVAVVAQQLSTVDERAIADAAVAAAAEQADVRAPVALTYANRPIVELRSALLGRPPEERVAAAHLALERLAEAGVTGPIETRPIGSVMAIDVAGRRVVVIMPTDVNTLAAETPAAVAAAAAQRLEVALNEVAELRRPRQLLLGVVQVFLATIFAAALVWIAWKARLAVRRRILETAERRLQGTVVGKAEFVRASRLIEFTQRGVDALTWILGLVLAYSWLTFGLRRFPYTRPWGESLRGFLLDKVSRAGLGIIESLPGLFTILLIFLITRFVIRIAQLLFQSIEEGRIAIPWVYAETAQSTRKILTVALWLFAVAMAYPYVPGSNSDAFKGMSVFVGLVLSLGSSGMVNQMMSGFTLTYSRALRMGDFVAVGDVEGTVSQLGTLSTKIKTSKGEDVTIPNALVVSQTVTNYSRFAETEGVLVPTDITIGYEVPWRQVEALLLLAAARTVGVRRDPPPRVREAALEGAYIRYTLLFCPENPADRRKTLATVHTNILDAFNEYGVQITSPNYEADPASPKIVPRDQWFAAPAALTAPAGLEADASALKT